LGIYNHLFIIFYNCDEQQQICSAVSSGYTNFHQRSSFCKNNSLRAFVEERAGEGFLEYVFSGGPCYLLYVFSADSVQSY
jgi:hypothetical protein